MSSITQGGPCRNSGRPCRAASSGVKSPTFPSPFSPGADSARPRLRAHLEPPQSLEAENVALVPVNYDHEHALAVTATHDCSGGMHVDVLGAEGLGCPTRGALAPGSRHLGGEDLSKKPGERVAVEHELLVHLSSRRSKAFRADAPRLVPERDERARGGLHERGRTAHEHVGAPSPRHLLEHCSIHAPAVAGPAGRLCPGERIDDLEAVPGPGQAIELVAVDDVVEGTSRVQKPTGHPAPGRRAVADHGHQRNDSRASGDQEERSSHAHVPDEVASDGSSELEHVAGPKLLDEIRGDLPVRDPLDREGDALLLGRGGDRVASLRLVAVLCRETHVDVLSRAMARPLPDLEEQALNARGLVDDPDDRAELPGQSPEYRCSRHGSPYMW